MSTLITKIVEKYIIVSFIPDKTPEEVNKRLSEGWELYGKPLLDREVGDPYCWIRQPMIKYKVVNVAYVR